MSDGGMLINSCSAGTLGARGGCMQCQRCFAERVCKGYLVRPVPAHLFSGARGAVLFLLRFGRGPERGCC